METKNTIAVIVSYMSPTTTKGSRVRIEIPRMGMRGTVSLDHSFSSITDQVRDSLTKHNVHPLFEAEIISDRHMFGVDFIHWDKLQTLMEGKIL